MVRFEPSGSVDVGASVGPAAITATALDRMMALLGSVTDSTLHGVVELCGRVDEELWERAMELLVAAEPILGCVFVPGGDEPCFVPRQGAARGPMCRLVEAPPDSEEALWRRLASEPLDATAGPLVSLTVLRGERDTLWLRLSHLVGDGASVRACLYQLTTILRALASDPLWRPPAGVSQRRGLGQIFWGQGAWGRLRMATSGLLGAALRASSPAYWRLATTAGVVGRRAGGRTYQLRHLSSHTVTAMRERARVEGATLNDLLVASYVKALADTIRPPGATPLPLRFTVDLRRYLPPGSRGGVRNLSSFGFLKLDHVPGRPYEDLVRVVKREMDAMKAGHLGLEEPALLGPLLRAAPFGWLERRARARRDARPGPELLTPTITNFGSLDPARLALDGSPPRRAYLLPPVVFPPGFALAVSGLGREAPGAHTARGERAVGITLSAGFAQEAIRRHRVARLLERMEEALMR